MIKRMKTTTSLKQMNTIAAIERFLAATQEIAFNLATSKQARYRWVQKTLVKHQYLLLGKADKGTTARYLMKVTNLFQRRTSGLN